MQEERVDVVSPARLFDESVLTFGLSAPDDAESVSTLEALGVESLWVGGHVVSRNPSPEANVALARLSATSKRPVIGTAILLLPLYPPAIVAKQIAEIDRASGGRVVLGVGVGGEYAQEFSACQVPVSERGSRTDEAIPLLRRLWSGETVEHDGPRYPMDGVRLQPPPAQPGGPPIVIAGRRDVAMRRAADLGDGWMPYLYSPERYRASVARIRERADEMGRDLSGFGWMLHTFVNVREDGDQARRELAQFLGGTYRDDFEARISRLAVAGDRAEVVERLVEFVDSGARHIVIVPCPRDDGDALARELLVEILPAVRTVVGL